MMAAGTVVAALGNEVLLVGGALLAYLIGRRLLSPQVPPILPALLIGIVLASATGRVHALPDGWAWPSFSVAAILTMVPNPVPLNALHSNLTAVAYLRSQDYAPPAGAIEVATGIATAIASFSRPSPVGMGFLVTALTAGPEIGERELRRWPVNASAAAFLLIAIGAGVAAELPVVLPMPLLLAVAGLAVLGFSGRRWPRYRKDRCAWVRSSPSRSPRRRFPWVDWERRSGRSFSAPSPHGYSRATTSRLTALVDLPLLRELKYDR